MQIQADLNLMAIASYPMDLFFVSQRKATADQLDYRTRSPREAR